MIIPIARATARRVSIFKENPKKFINAKVPKIEIGILMADTSVIVALRKKIKTTDTAKNTPRSTSNSTEEMAARTFCVVSLKTLISYSGLIDSICGSTFITASAMEISLAPAIFCTSKITPGVLLKDAKVLSSSMPSSIVAISANLIPSAIRIFPISLTSAL